MSSCIVHYNDYTDEEEPLIYAKRESYDKLVNAKSKRVELGGEHAHTEQGRKIPVSYGDNLFYHRKCYQKYTMAVSIKRKRDEQDSTSSQSQSCSRGKRRKGNLGTILFPLYCMLCKKVTKYHKRKKQVPKKLELATAEYAIREAAEKHNDEELLLAIRNIELRAAEFRDGKMTEKVY